MQFSNHLLYAVKLHFTANRRRSSRNQRSVARLVRRNGDDCQTRVCGATLSNKRLSFAVVEIIVRKDQIEITGSKCVSRRSQTRHNRNTMRSQELTRDLLGEHGVVLKVENVHG